MITFFKSQTLQLSHNKSFIIATVFTILNLLLPQLFHVFNLGGERFLPIILFTIIAAGAFGMSVALITAIVSPLISMLIFGMPSIEMMTVLMAKGATIAIVLGYLAQKQKKVSIIDILITIVAYQAVGVLIATVIFNFDMALNSIIISYPAIIMQICLGTLAIKYISKYVHI